MFFENNNYGIFDDEDENKHEYMQMHKEYLSVMEKKIYARLQNQQVFTGAEILAFINTFEQNK